MSNFVDDDLDLANFPKTNQTTPPVSGLASVVTAADMNNVRQALLDLKGKARAGTTVDYVIKPAGLVADGGSSSPTDNLAALAAALTSAQTLGATLLIPGDASKIYFVSKFIDVSHARGLKIRGNGAVLRYPSDNASLHASGNALTDNQARSAMLLRYCTDVTIDGLVFQGGTAQAFDTVNLGVAIYETHCQGTRIVNCTSLDGNTLHAQDAQTNTLNTGDSLAVAAGVVTLTSATALFQPGHVGHTVTIKNATNKANNGVFVIASYVSATQITYANAAGVAETTAALCWEVDDGDRDTWIVNCRVERARGPMTIASHSRIIGGSMRQPLTVDYAGVPSSFVTGGGNTTMYAVNGAWDGSVVGRYVKIAGSTSGANDGPAFLITAATPRSRFAPASLTYVNAGVTEAGNNSNTVPGTYFIAGGEKVGKGNGAAAIAVAAGVVTLTASAAVFAAADVGKSVRLTGATTLANNGAFIIASVVSSTQITFANGVGVSEAYAGVWSVDSWDAIGPSGGAFGSTAAIYMFAGRQYVLVDGVEFVGIRKDCVKVSGSSLPIRGIRVTNCTAVECGGLFTGGADDSQEHCDMTIDNNTLIDVATGRPGWNQGNAITILGSTGTTVNGNRFHSTRPAVSAVDGRASIAGIYGIFAARYVSGRTQPIENFSAIGNRFTADRVNTRGILNRTADIHAERVGQLAYWNQNDVGVHLTNNAGIVTLQDNTAAFSQDLVGCPVQIYGATSGGNNGVFIVTSVTGTSSLTYANGAGVTEAFPAAGCSYRIKRPFGQRGGVCDISSNQHDSSSSNAIETVSCTGPVLRGNVWNNMGGIVEAGSVAPLIVHNREVSAPNSNAGIQLSATTAWPIVYDNFITNPDLSGGGTITGGALTPEKPAAVRRDIGIGIGNGTVIDHPLLGKTGRATRNYGQAELMLAFGSDLVEGDTFSCDGSPLYYTASAGSSYPKFNTQAELIARLTGSGVTAGEYGARFMTPVTTGHIAAKLTTATGTANPIYFDTINILNPTALVIPRNAVGGGESFQYARGEAWDPAIVAQSVTVVAAAGTYTRAAGNFLTDGFYSGQSVTWSGFVNGGNNGAKTVISVSATVLTFATAGLVNETSAAAVASTGVQDRRVAIWSPLASSNGVRMSADNVRAANVLAAGYLAPPVPGDAGCCKVVQFNAIAGGTTGAFDQEEYRWELS